MLNLNTGNLVDYIRTHYPAFDTSGAVTVSTIGTGSGDDESVGLVNYLYRVTNEKQSIIVKHGRDVLRISEDSGSDRQIPPERNYLEYTSLKLRGAITPQWVPEVYYADRENHVFFMEDVSYLKPSRSLLTKNIMVPGLAERCGQFLAHNHFYTTEFYMDTDEFRQFSKFFTNSGMRSIMENWLFLRQNAVGEYDPLTESARPFVFDPTVVAHSHMMRHKYMNCTQAFLHSDFHTGNIFADENRIKVIDMEYTFAGPCAYDVGYLMSNLISQYCSATFRAFPSVNERKAFKAYILESVYDLLHSYLTRFADLWNSEAKEVYRSTPRFRDLFLDTIIPDAAGFSAMFTMTITVDPFITTHEFLAIPEEELRRHALSLYCAIGRRLLLQRDAMRKPEDIISVILQLEQDYLRELRRY